MHEESKQLYKEIESLREKKQKLMATHKDKYIKTQHTHKMIKKEITQIDSQIQNVQVIKEQEAVKHARTLKKHENQMAASQLQINQLAAIHQGLESQILNLDQTIVDFQSQKDDKGSYKYQNKQLQEDLLRLQEVESQIQSLQNSKNLLLEQNQMIIEDCGSQQVRLVELEKVIKWKTDKMESKERKVQNKKAKLYIDVETERESIKVIQKQAEALQKVTIPTLQQNTKLYLKLTESLDSSILEILNQKEILLNRIHENKCFDHGQDENLILVAKLSVKKEHIVYKQVEVQEKIKLMKQKLQEHKTQKQQYESTYALSLETHTQKLQALTTRQKQLAAYESQLEMVVKPTLEKLDNKIKQIDKELDQTKYKLIRVNKRISKNNGGQLSREGEIPASEELQRQHNDEEDIDSCQIQGLRVQQDFKPAQQHLQVAADDTSVINQVYSFINFQFEVDVSKAQDEEPSKVMSENQREAEKVQIPSHNLSMKDDISRQIQLFNQDEPLVTYNNPDMFCRILPLVKGIEVYKKHFDTKLLNLNQQQKYNPLQVNKRITPDQLGYQLRTVRLSKLNIGVLEFVSTHEDSHPKVEVTIDLLQAKFMIPKFSQDSLKIQKQQKQPLKQLNLDFSSSNNQKFTKQKKQSKSSIIMQEQDEYNQKCLNAPYYQVSFIQRDKEYDILISNAGGYFNFEIFRRAVESIQSLSKKERQKIQAILTSKMQNK